MQRIEINLDLPPKERWHFAADCRILNDKAVKMQITVQQMVFNARKGLIEVKDML